VLDLGTLVDAIHVAEGSHLDLRRLRIPNSGNRRLSRRPSERVRLQVAGIFALWPSVTLAKDSRVRQTSTKYWNIQSLQSLGASCSQDIHAPNPLHADVKPTLYILIYLSVPEHSLCLVLPHNPLQAHMSPQFYIFKNLKSE